MAQTFQVGETVIVKDSGQRALVTALLPEDRVQVEYLPDPAQDPIDRDSSFTEDVGGVYLADELESVPNIPNA